MSATTADAEATFWQRRRSRRRARPMYRRADRAVLRSLATLVLPGLGLSVAAWKYHQGEDLKSVALAAAVAGAVWLTLTPLALWWAVSGLRRGTRMVITGVLCGVAAGLGTVGLAVALYGAAAGWTLLTGEPLPQPLPDVAVPLPDGLR